ncbi:MAG: carbohydrate porin [Sphingomonadales bacterium]|nr:carbohydrate porin [Sphingomonadales bacterium]
MAQPADGAAAETPGSATQDPFAFHGQTTFTVQTTPGFASPYLGTNSLKPHQTRETFDATWFIGARLWQGAELWGNPEVDQGFGLSDTVGVAGFPSGEAYKVGKAQPYLRLQRLFIRQTIDLGGAAGAVAAGANAFARRETANRLVITLGKISVPDIFDTNTYAHDPRADFFNWTVIDTGTFDYAADSWGYTYGAAAEWYQADWTLRGGFFALSAVPNSETLDSSFAQYQIDGEIEHRHKLGGRPGAIRVTLFRNRGRFEHLADAIAIYDATGTIPDPATLRRPTTRWGGQINAEQEITDALGLFVRAGLAGGSIEADEFTDIDRTLAFGGKLSGDGWGRKADAIGLAFVDNAISRQRRMFLADGGLGILVGDGRLPAYGDEHILEAFYDWQVIGHVNLTADYQFIANPAYNPQRGPVNVFGLRLHAAI